MSTRRQDVFGAPITRVRGNTAPDRIRVTGLDLTGFSYAMKIGPERNGTPEDVIVEINGVIEEVGPPGSVQFPWTAEHADQTPATYWYEIRQTDNLGKVLTIVKQTYTFLSDVDGE